MARTKPSKQLSQAEIERFLEASGEPFFKALTTSESGWQLAYQT
nr:hypothetical protein [Mesorhizobium loti]